MERADVPLPLTQLMWQLLAKDATWRPSGAREVCDRLLAFAGPAGALGDINPAGADAAAVLGYALVLARMADGRAGAEAPVPGAMPVPMARAPAGDAAGPRGTAWRVWHSLWILPTLLLGGFGAWLSFGYIAAVHRRRTWFVAAAIYLVVGVGGRFEPQPSLARKRGQVVWMVMVVHAPRLMRSPSCSGTC